MNYENFWRQFKQHVKNEQCQLNFKYDNEKNRWTKLNIGKPGTILELRPVDSKRIILAQVRFLKPETQTIFEHFYKNSKKDIESEIGSPLIWENNEPGKVTCKINLEEPFDLNDHTRWQWAFNWIIEKANIFMSVFIPRLGGSSASFRNNENDRKATINNASSGTFSGETPLKEEIESILRSLCGETDEDTLKDAIINHFQKEKRTLRPDWWEITMKNLLEWSKKR